MSREDQKRVEVRPGVFLWLNEADQAAFRALTPPEAIESASITPPENAALATPKPRKPTAPVKRATRKPKV